VVAKSADKITTSSCQGGEAGSVRLHCTLRSTKLAWAL
jgi:hypothetical protein